MPNILQRGYQKVTRKFRRDSDKCQNEEENRDENYEESARNLAELMENFDELTLKESQYIEKRNNNPNK